MSLWQTTPPITERLDSVFRATRYQVRVAAGHCFNLRIEQPMPELGDYLSSRGMTGCTIITPCNPGAEQLPAASNQVRLQAMRSQLIFNAHHPFVATLAVADHGTWPDEPGFCLFNMSTDDTIRMARTWRQVAWVSVNAAGMPSLIWIDRDACKPTPY